MDMFPGAAAFLRGNPVPRFQIRFSVSAFYLWSLWGLFAPGVQGADVSAFQARSWKISASKSIPYRLFAPKNREAGRKYPIMLSLHGLGERGTNNTSQLTHAFNTMWADDSIQKSEPCFVVLPQCPPNDDWNANTVLANYDFSKTPITDDLQAVMYILDSLEREFPIDKDREYVSGMSMGGAAAWYTIMRFPDRFAAAVPVCGRGDPKQAPSLDRVNIWTFHAADDPTVPVTTTRELAAAIRAVGGTRLKYTEYPANLHYGHESWKPAGRDPELHRWVFAQTRAQTTVLRPLRPSRSDAASNLSLTDAPGTGILVVDPLGRVRLRRSIPVPLYSRRSR
jgi:predicted peptidase